jgi:hypothetical protein
VWRYIYASTAGLFIEIGVRGSDCLQSKFAPRKNAIAMVVFSYQRTEVDGLASSIEILRYTSIGYLQFKL